MKQADIQLAPIVRSVVWDEVQELRKQGTDRYSSAAKIAESVEFRLSLSATPIYNYGGEIFSVMECTQPGALGEYDEFYTEWCTGSGDKIKIKDPSAFGAYLRDSGRMLLRTRKDVGRELPPLQTIPHYVNCDENVLNEIQGAAAQLARTILSLNSGKEARFLASGEFDAMMRQRTGIAKAPHVADFVRMLVEGGERVLLYGWHREVYRIWLERLADLNPVMYTGSESSLEKERSKQRFCAPLEGEGSEDAARILIMSLRAGAGLDGLQHACRTVVYGELDWSPGVHEQCTGRVNRDGQPDPVAEYYLIAEHGSDPVVAGVLGVKTRQIAGIRDDARGELVERLEADPNHVRKLAEAYLAQRGLSVDIAAVARGAA